MPTPGRTTTDEVVAAARALVEAGGPDALTMQAVAAQVGVRAPSLYKRVRSREHLLGLVVDGATRELAAALDAAAAAEPDPARRIVALARALRRHAHAHPRLFGLLFAPLPAGAAPPRDALLPASAAVLRACEEMVGPARALDAARTVTAWAYGFLTMELSGAFQLGGDPADAFGFGAEAVARSIATLAA
ncbi:TetR/AcrR family transcriptional regulator [Xylanimonas protaetiae]|uniref:TetR/AcrR family transcriptional regulator n=1 Tax=Xylanimonas protaetiae TaxID=2509457 RepID=A0A4P6F2A2_9MICO|nr:TetR/AcrR family transcriptional regulator [Xylanimonas protaetiae]QAY68843.1 TetR/AcrR family transcriptional regulator [Xylanimonas protaetiae]